MRHRVLVPILSIFVLAFVGRPIGAHAEPSPCTTYEVEATSDGATAEAFVHLAGEPLVGHVVFATFDDAAGGESVADPVVLSTDGDGRARVELPVGAVSVAFSTESPRSGECVGAGPAELVVVTARVGAPQADVGDPLTARPTAENLAVTGPVSPVVAVLAVLMVAAGWVAGRLRGPISGRDAGRIALRSR
ncbi:MAG: hypothetical protein ACKOHN_02535 [Actinomycetota bacterium]